MKICTKCKIQKDLSEFHSDKQKKDGLCSQCAECKKSHAKKYRVQHIDMVRFKDREHRHSKYIKNKKRENENAVRWQKNNIDKVRKSALSSYYKNEKRFKKRGITFLYFQEMLSLQDSKCAICGKKLIKSQEQHIDHDHKTTKLRMILCPKCNHGLGSFNDDANLLEIAAAYLRGFSNEF